MFPLPCPPKRSEYKKSEIEKNSWDEFCVVPSSFCAGSHGEKGTFYKHAGREQTKENIAFIWGHVHESRAALWTTISARFPHLWGWRCISWVTPVLQLLALLGLQEEEESRPVSVLAMVVCLSLWCSSQSVVGSRGKRTPVSPSPQHTREYLTSATAAVTIRGCELCPRSHGLSFLLSLRDKEAETMEGRRGRQLQAVVSVSRSCSSVHHSLRTKVLIQHLLFLSFCSYPRSRSWEFGGLLRS